MKRYLTLILTVLLIIVNSITAFADEKTLVADITKDYTAAKFVITFDEAGEYEVTITDPSGKNTYSAVNTNSKEYTCIVQDVKSGKWNVKITTASEAVEGAEEDASEIGTVHIKIEGSSQELAESSSDIVVAEDINGLELYFIDETFVAEWSDTSKGNMNVTVTDAKSQEQLAAETVTGTHFECEIDPSLHENITVTLVPSTSSNVSNAERRWTLPTYNQPDAELVFEDARVTNKDVTPLLATLGKDYKITAYLNGRVVYDEDCKAGENSIDLTTEVGTNNYTVYVTDLETGYKRSYTYSIEKDVVAPVIKFASSYENITTTAEELTFEGEIDVDYVTFTINDADIKVEGDHTFKYTYSLKEGANNISIIATDEAGNVTEYDTIITRQIPEVAKVPWAPIIISVSLIGLLITYIVTMIVRRKNNGGEEKSKKGSKKPKKASGKIKSDNTKEKKQSIDVIPMWLQFILRVGIPVLGVVILLSKVVCITIVASGSMEPKLKTGNTAVYNRLAYTKSSPQRGDIIGFWSQEFNATYAKRVIGIAGDNIEFHNGYVYINGMKADESQYIGENIETNSNKTFIVPEGCVFVLGDNRENSIDSRFWSNPYISCEDIVGKYIGQFPFVLPDIFGISDDDSEERFYTEEDVRMAVELYKAYSEDD